MQSFLFHSVKLFHILIWSYKPDHWFLALKFDILWQFSRITGHRHLDVIVSYFIQGLSSVLIAKSITITFYRNSRTLPWVLVVTKLFSRQGIVRNSNICINKIHREGQYISAPEAFKLYNSVKLAVTLLRMIECVCCVWKL